MDNFPLVSKCQVNGENIEIMLLNVFEHENYPGKQYVIYSASKETDEKSVMNIGILLENNENYRIINIEDFAERVEMLKLLDEYISLLESDDSNGNSKK